MEGEKSSSYLPFSAHQLKITTHVYCVHRFMHLCTLKYRWFCLQLSQILKEVRNFWEIKLVVQYYIMIKLKMQNPSIYINLSYNKYSSNVLWTTVIKQHYKFSWSIYGSKCKLSKAAGYMVKDNKQTSYVQMQPMAYNWKIISQSISQKIKFYGTIIIKSWALA